MRTFNLFYLLLLLLLVATVVLVEGASINRPNFHMRRRYHRHFCLHRRCLPLHSRVPFP
ncbi:apelin receptor early endogenous ligand [Stigmatopora nigra]